MGAAPGEALGAFVFGFVYPGYVALLLAPLALLPFGVAATVWLLLAQAATGGGAWLAWNAAGRDRPDAVPARATPALLVALLFPASLYNLAFGQFAALVFAALAGAWYLLAHPDGAGPRRAWPAGALVALAAVKPSLALLPGGALLLWCLWRRRWGVLAAAGAGLALLLGASLWLLPGWPADFWRSTVDYARVAGATSASGVVAGLLGRGAGAPQVAAPPGLAAGVAVLATGAVCAGWAASPRRPGDALAGGVLLGAWLVPPLYEWNSVLLLLPLLGWLRSLAGRRALPLAAGGVLLAGAATVPLLLRWPYETRALWPALVLAGWTAAALAGRAARYRGTKTATLRAGSSPSSAALT
jgi:alpha-1,2-mannosyltransferase